MFQCFECFMCYQIVHVNHWIPPKSMKGFISFSVSSLIQLFSDICHLEHLCSMAPFIHFHISPPSFHHSPVMDVTLCMCLSLKKRSWQKGGAQNCERHKSGLPFGMNGALAARQSVCHTACESIWLPISPSCVEQRPQTEAEEAVWNYIPVDSNNQTCLCVYGRLAHPSLLFLLVLSGNTVSWQALHFWGPLHVLQQH